MSRRRQYGTALVSLVLAASPSIHSLRAAASASASDGAGATFPAPLYAEWARIYAASTGIHIDYRAVGSGAGIEQIQHKDVDFAATDAPLTLAAQRTLGLAQYPVVAGGVVPVVNLSGIRPGALRLSGTVLADIYLGKIRRWSDPAIARLNQGLHLPESNITVVHRRDASGTTFLWTDFLSKLSPEWLARIGSGLVVNWPAGVSGVGNQGVASYVQRTRMSIGYVEYAYAKQNHLSHVAVENREGIYVQPTRKSFAAAVESAHWSESEGFFRILTNAPGADSWPITGASFVLLHTAAEQPARSRAAMQFFSWALSSGQAVAEELEYVALPPDLAQQVEQAFKQQIRDTAGQEVWRP
jgi:phosphate transport system substrate-binding protein